MATARPFTLAIPDDALDDLKARLRRTRFADTTPGPAWTYGTDGSWLRETVSYWSDGFDWRAAEARLNGLQQQIVSTDGIDIHVIHVPGRGPAPTPLLLSHGWPGSIFEFMDIIPRLTDPARFGGDPVDAFTVVAPSLPGYGLSYVPGQRRFGINDIADCFAQLMTVLGYKRFLAQGGDWGSAVATRLGFAHPDRLLGLHLNMLPIGRDPTQVPAGEAAYAEELRAFLKDEAGYQQIQGTKPDTLAFALADSPAGLVAWIGEKFMSWTDNDGDLWSAVSRDAFLADVSLYWFTGAIGSSFWPYYARIHGETPVPPGETVDVPTAYAEFPREILHPPRSIAEKTYTDLRRWTRMTRGGHFAALEQPIALAEDIAAFARALRV